MAPEPVPVSIICVFNDPEVRKRCLDRSIEERRHEAPVEYVPVDNVDGSFGSAGAALNHGASLAKHEVLAFVHQDVYLHSLRALESAARALMDDEEIGLIGAIGPHGSGKLIGRIRDRVVLLGEAVREPTEVDSLDELLFMARRSLVMREPLAESPELAWHAYAVEYGLRMRSLGLRVCAGDIFLTHNSVTANLDRLDVARRAVAVAHPDALPVRVPGGLIAPRPRRGAGILRSHRWRYRWLRESIAAHLGARASEGSKCVLGDIRLDVDDLMASAPDPRLLVINIERAAPRNYPSSPVEMTRLGRTIEVTADSMTGLIDRLPRRGPGVSTLITNLRRADLRALSGPLAGEMRLLGYHGGLGYWLVLGPLAAERSQRWRTPSARPLGMPAPA